jgi:hypothetical protein
VKLKVTNSNQSEPPFLTGNFLNGLLGYPNNYKNAKYLLEFIKLEYLSK